MTQEHPFAQYVRTLGKGPNLSRPLTFEEAADAGRLILADAVEPVQLGAFLCLLRVKTETPEEVAGLALAARESLALAARESLGTPAQPGLADVDWPTYAGKARHLPYFLLSALLLAENGVRVFLHGAAGHTEGRVYSNEALAALGLPLPTTLNEAAVLLRERNFAFLDLADLSPRLSELMALKSVLGVRSPLHTVVRHLNPFGAPCEVVGVTHPPYRTIHREAARLLGCPSFVVWKGEGGEAERRPEKACETQGLVNNSPVEEEWPALPGLLPPAADLEMPLARLAALWRGEVSDDYAAAVVQSTAALVLKAIGRASTQDEALAQARQAWEKHSALR